MNATPVSEKAEANAIAEAAREEMARVKMRLNEMDYSWADLARNLNTSNQRVNNWKSRGLPKSELVDIAHFLQCSIEWLITGVGSVGVRNTRSHSPADDAAIALLDRLEKAYSRIGALEAELCLLKNEKKSECQ